MILAKQKTGDLEYYRCVLPLRGYQSITINEVARMEAAQFLESSFNWGKDLRTIRFKNLNILDLPKFEGLETVAIDGFADSPTNRLVIPYDAGTLQNLVINDASGNPLNTFYIYGGTIRNMIISGLTCKGATGSLLRFEGRDATVPLLEMVDLPVSYQPASIAFYKNNGSTFPFVNFKLVIRSPNFIPCSAADNWNNTLSNRFRGIYVPDGLVNAYKSASGWNQMASKIYPISNLG